MNYIIKSAKNHQKTSSDLNSKLKKKQVSSPAMIFKSNLLNIQGNLVSASINKNFMKKRKKILGIKNLIKTNTNDSYPRNSSKKAILNEPNTSVESKGEVDFCDDSLTNNLTSSAINNESNLSNAYFKRTLLTSSKNIRNKKLKNKEINKMFNNSNNNLNLNLNLNNCNTEKRETIKKEEEEDLMNSKKNSLDILPVYKSQSNKEIKNNIKDITQRCRHKQVKREIYINNENNKSGINEKNKNMILKAVQKLKNNIMNVDISQDFGKNENKFIIETPTSTKENDSNLQIKRPNKDKDKEQEKDNLNYNNHSKKQISLLEHCDADNKPNKKGNKNVINDKDDKIAGSNNNKKKSLGYFKSVTINSKIKKIKSPFFQYNYIKCENNISNDNINNSNNLNNSEIEKPKRTYHKFNSNDNIDNMNYINKSKSINKMNSEQNKKISNNINNNLNSIINYNNRKLNKIIKKQNSKIITENGDKKAKENDICFDENELDENTLSVTTGKYIENKKCQTMINKVLHFETGSNEIFNNFRTQTNNSLSNMSFLNKNQSTKSMKDKKNSCNNIINRNYVGNHSSNNNVTVNNINAIIKNNIDYNLKKRKKRKNEPLLKKCNTDVIIDNNNTEKKENIPPKNDSNNYELFFYQEDSSDNNNIINQEYYSSESSTTSIKVSKNHTNKNIMIHKKFRVVNYSNKRLFYKVFQCQEFKKYLLNFCDIHLLNKICLLSKQIYSFFKPLIYKKINHIIYNTNKNSKNLKIKKYLMEKYSPLSKLSNALIRKQYTDLKFENNHIYDAEIKKDLTRTFPDNILFKYGNNYYNKLYHVLTAFSNYNKNIGYTQGLNFLAAHIIYFFDEEIDEFIFLESLIHKFELDKILSVNDNNFFMKKMEDINNFIKFKLPKLSRYLNEMKLNYEFFTTNWVLTLLANSMETKHLFYVWDYMIVFGWKFFKCFVVVVMMNFENDILNATQNNLTFIMKNMLKNEQFNSNFKLIIIKTIQMLIKENEII